MRKDEIKNQLKETAFDFFYWFSRFEFALKERKILKSNQMGRNAEANWKEFADRYSENFQHTNHTTLLIKLSPKRQKVGENSELVWKDVDLTECKTDLHKVVLLLNTIRNNLFHGGKHRADGWDDPEKTEELLTVGKEVLNHLAKMANLEDDYNRIY